MTELSEAISEAMPEALNEYLARMETLYGTNYEAISVRKEITFEPLGVTLKIGSLLFFERGDIDQSTFEIPLFRMKSALDNFLDSLSLKEEQGDYSTVTMDNGEEAKLFSTDEELLFTMEPYTLEGREPFVTLGELSLWAIHQWFKDNGKDSPVPVFLYKIFPTLYPESEEPLKQDVYPVVSHVAGLSKLTAKITEIPNAETYNIDVSGKNEGRKVYTSIRLDYDDSSVSLSKPMDAFDREVQDAIASLYAAGNLVITPPQVYRAMTGAPNSRRPSNRMLEEIEASMDKQRRIMAVIDYSEELRGRLLDGESITKTKLEHWMIDASKVTVVTAKGTKSVGYQIHAAPILYEHDKRTRQITSYPMELLEATASVASNTRRNTLIRAYLIKRIQQMKNHSCPKQIKYETIMANIGEAGAGREAKKAVMEATRSYLDAFRKEGFIKAWKEYRAAREKAGRTITGVEIELEAVS